MIVGYLMTFVPVLMFWGAILSLTGALVVFLVGTVYADLWAAHRRTQQIIKERDERFAEAEELPDIEDPVIEDPFEETYDAE
jgi:fatty acid desaturase